jgi:glycosyltransferase involved in cell wall biosynthesis
MVKTSADAAALRTSLPWCRRQPDGRCRESILEMRILHFIPSLHSSFGGPARAVIDLCGALALQGHEVTLLTSDAGQAAQSWRNVGPRAPNIVLLPPAFLPGYTYLGDVRRTFRSLVRHHDLVHVHGIWELANIQICTIARQHSVPYVVSVHGMLGRWPMAQRALKKRMYLQAFGKKWLRGASRIHLTAQGEFEAAARFFPKALGRVVPLLIDLESYCQLPGPDQAEALLNQQAGRPRILFLSRLHPVKSLETLLEAARLLSGRGRSISIVVAGDGDPSYVARLKAAARDLPHVIFLGMVTGDLKLSLYQACDMFVLPSRHENFGVVFIEALGCGLPVITTNTVGLSAELESSGAVMLVDRTPEQFAAAIENLLADGSRSVQMGARGREWVFETFDPAASVGRFESLYAEVLAESGTTNPGRVALLDPLST